MQTLRGKDDRDWVRMAWTWVHENVRPGQRVFVPAGGTPTPLYRRLTQEPTELWKSLTLIQLDEIISGPQKGHFRRFFESELAPFTKQMEWIGEADHGADVAILGVGVNGHVAFHEPHLPREFTSGCVRLTDETRGYLGLHEETWGLTYGVGAFLRARKILVLAQGANKQTVIRRALAGDELPITWILRHSDVTLLTDFAT